MSNQTLNTCEVDIAIERALIMLYIRTHNIIVSVYYKSTQVDMVLLTITLSTL